MHAESDKVNWTEFENGDNISINNAKPLMHVPLLVKRLFIRPYRWRWWKSPPNIHFICFKLLLCLCNIFSFSTFFFTGQVKLFQLKFAPNIYMMPPQTILYGKMRCTDIDSLFSCFECIIYYLIFLKQHYVSW